MLTLRFIQLLDYCLEIPHGFWQDVIITALGIDSLDNFLQLLCNTMTVKGKSMTTLNLG